MAHLLLSRRGPAALRFLGLGLLGLGLGACNALLGTDGFGPEGAAQPSATGGGSDADGAGGAGSGGGGAAPITARHLWSRGIGSEGLDLAAAVAIADHGDVVLAGTLGGSLTLGETTLDALGGGDGLVARFDAEGEPLWARSFGGPGGQAVTGVALDDDGAIFIAATNGGTMEVGEDTFTALGASDVVVAKLGTNGVATWARSFEGAGASVVHAIAVDAGGDVVISGSLRGTVSVGGDMLAGDADRDDAFSAKLDGADGDLVWIARWPGTSGDHAALDVATDGAGRVFVVGTFEGALDLGSETLSAEGASDGFLVVLDGQGEVELGRVFGGSGADEVAAVASLDGGVVIGGHLTGPVDLGGGELEVEAGRGALFVARLDGQGEHVWSAAHGAADANRVERIAVDVDGNVLIAGGFAGHLGLDDGVARSSAGGSDAFVAKRSADGGLLWAADFGRNDEDRVHGVATDADGNVLLVGGFHGAFQLEASEPRIARGDTDAFVVKLAP